MGYPLYRRLGFREVGRFRVQVPGDDAFLDIPALVLVPAPPSTAAPRRPAITPAQVAPPLETLPPMIEVY